MRGQSRAEDLPEPPASAAAGSATPAADSLIREIPLIARYARHNQAEDLRFRDFLKSRANRPTAEIDLIVTETTAEVWAQIDCVKCANCCRSLQVVVDGSDIDRLAARLGMSVARFGAKFVKTGPDGARFLASTPCHFLGEDGRCTVYEDRPRACRDFPYLTDRHFAARSLMMIENTALCPIVFNVWQKLKARLGFRRGEAKGGGSQSAKSNKRPSDKPSRKRNRHES